MSLGALSSTSSLCGGASPSQLFCLFVFCPPSFQDATLLILFLTSLVTPSQSPLLDLISQTSKHGCSTGLSLWMFLFIITTLVISFNLMTLNMVDNLDDFQIYVSSPDFSFKLPVFLQNMSIQMSNRYFKQNSWFFCSHLRLSQSSISVTLSQLIIYAKNPGVTFDFSLFLILHINHLFKNFFIFPFLKIFIQFLKVSF